MSEQERKDGGSGKEAGGLETGRRCRERGAVVESFLRDEVWGKFKGSPW